ncbi:hypothetical protein OG936_14865 [Streptomyces sp. NBC_00846]|uniref:hypothetical protein n=1 Tax=Streptomyces sp. NBC_00846 TaxID=2975849 RepID=UPI00386BA2FC|nr:hypothetical protein OG936_14865 [Streptomyces sp. NBC_00846]
MPDNVMDSRPQRTWIASLISTIVTLPLAFFALVFGALSPMACDACEEAEAHRFDTSFDSAWTVLTVGLVLALITLVTSWALSRQRPPAALALAVLAPGVVFFAWVTFMALVDWP